MEKTEGTGNGRKLSFLGRLSSKVRAWWTYQRIQQQIFFSMLLVSLLGTALLGSISYRISSRALEENYQLSHEYALKNSSKVLDMKLSPVIEMIRSFLYDPNLQHVLEEQTEDGRQSFAGTEQKLLKNVGERLTKQENSVNYVAFMDLYGHYYLLSNVNLGTYEFYQYYGEHNFLEEFWSREARAANGREVFFGQSVLGGIPSNGFSIVKYLNNPATLEPMGYLVVDVNRRMLGNFLVTGTEGYETNEYLIADLRYGGEVVYANHSLTGPQAVLEEFCGGRQQRYLFTSVHNAVTGWELINVIERNELSAGSKRIRNTVFLCGGLLVILSFGLAMAISRTITRPLNQLEQVIEQVREGERHITEEFDESEAGRIGRKFKEMVNTNLELSEYLLNARLKEREAELLLLQSQINPHFLYNTLDSLYCMAIIHGDDQIANMILALSDHFKLSLNKGKRFGTVADTVTQIEDYMKLQGMRFKERFKLSVEVDEDILQEEMLTFLLQPFVENAIYHGLEPKLGGGTIWVRGRRDGERLLFTVEDDGVGIEDMGKMNSGFGISNVRERIQLHYGEDYGLTVESEKGKGTKITIVLPLNKGEQVCVCAASANLSCAKSSAEMGLEHVPAGSD